EHVVELGDVEVMIRDQWIIDGASGDGIDVLEPPQVILNWVHGQADNLHSALVELWPDRREIAKLGGADWREILWVRKKHSPAVVEPIVEANPTFGGVGHKVRCLGANAKGHDRSSFLSFTNDLQRLANVPAAGSGF